MGKTRKNSATSYLCVSKIAWYSLGVRGAKVVLLVSWRRDQASQWGWSVATASKYLLSTLFSPAWTKSPPHLSSKLLVFSWSMSPRPRLLSCHPPPLLHGQEAPSPHVSRQEHLNCHIWWSSGKRHRHQFIIVVTKNKDSILPMDHIFNSKAITCTIAHVTICHLRKST